MERELDDFIGISEDLFGLFWLIVFEGIGAVSAGASGANPGDEGAGFIVGESAAVREFSDVGIGMPGWHLLGEDDLGDHLGPAVDFSVVGHRERSNASLGVALHAAIFEDGSNVFAVGD